VSGSTKETNVRRIALFVMILSSIVVLASDSSRIPLRVHVVPFNEKGSPVEILGWTNGNDSTKGPRVVFKNVSERAIVGIGLATWANVSRDCPNVTRQVDHWNIGEGVKVESVALKPHEVGSSTENLLAPSTLVYSAVFLASRDIEVRLRVAKVTFSDGTQWTSAEDTSKPTHADKSADCAGQSAFSRFPMEKVAVQLSDTKKGNAGPSKQVKILKDWTLDCETGGSIAYCE
jgi:hypothetical protein